MLHAKVMIVDDVWSVVGSTNLDNRSFGLNDEVNLAGFDDQLAARLQEDFARDLADSLEITYEEWKRRSLFERAHEWLGWCSKGNNEVSFLALWFLVVAEPRGSREQGKRANKPETRNQKLRNQKPPEI